MLNGWQLVLFGICSDSKDTKSPKGNFLVQAQLNKNLQQLNNNQLFDHQSLYLSNQLQYKNQYSKNLEWEHSCTRMY